MNRSRTRALDRLRLLVVAWRLHGVAQALRAGMALADVRDRLAHLARREDAAPTDALWAAAWTGRIGRRLLGRLDTCLVRALVAGSLIGGDADVELRIGVHRPFPGADLLDGHAWLLVDGGPLPDAGDAQTSFETVHSLPLHSRS